MQNPPRTFPPPDIAIAGRPHLAPRSVAAFWRLAVDYKPFLERELAIRAAQPAMPGPFPKSEK